MIILRYGDGHVLRIQPPLDVVVDDLDEWVEMVQLAGYETDTSQPPLDGYKRAHIFDPFGNRIELMEKI